MEISIVGDRGIHVRHRRHEGKIILAIDVGEGRNEVELTLDEGEPFKHPEIRQGWQWVVLNPDYVVLVMETMDLDQKEGEPDNGKSCWVVQVVDMDTRKYLLVDLDGSPLEKRNWN